MESLFPILIFIVWIIIFAVANQKKRQKQLEKTRTPQPQGPQSSTRQPVSISDEIKRTLESIYGSTTGGETDTTTLEEKTESPKAESTVSSETTISDLQNSLIKQKRLLEQQQTELFYKHYDSQTASDFVFTRDELRRGIILSEILAPPVALRE